MYVKVSKIDDECMRLIQQDKYSKVEIQNKLKEKGATQAQITKCNPYINKLQGMISDWKSQQNDIDAVDNQIIADMDISKTEKEIDDLQQELLTKQQHLKDLRMKTAMNMKPQNIEQLLSYRFNEDNDDYKDFVQNKYISDIINQQKEIKTFIHEPLSILAAPTSSCIEFLCPHGIAMIGGYNGYLHVCDLCGLCMTWYWRCCNGNNEWCKLCVVKINKLTNIRLDEQLRKQQEFKAFIKENPDISLDLLTGLKNKTALQRTLDFICSMDHTEKASNHGLILFDVDHFKDVNDILGHQKGDELLKMIGNELHEIEANPSKFKNRKFIHCYRDGGDEFAIVFYPGGWYHDGADIYEELAQRIQNVSAKFGKQITISVGITPCHKNPCHLNESDKKMYHSSVPFKQTKEWKQKTDEALYASKKSGRNTVRFWIYSGQSHGAEIWDLNQVNKFRYYK